MGDLDSPAPNSPGRARLRLGIRDILVFLIAGCWGAGVQVGRDYQRFPPFAEENNIAIHLARGEGFGSPMDPSAHPAPTSWSPPIYPWLMAGIYRACGIRTPAATTALMLLNACCFAAVVAGIRGLGAACFSPAAGWVAAGLLIIHPIFLFYISQYWDAYLALALFIWILVAVQRSSGLASVLTIAAGLGVLSLINAAYVFAYPLIVWRAVRLQPMSRRFNAIALSVGVFCLVLAPWTVRNAIEFRRLMYVRGGAEFELWLGNRIGASGLIDDATLAQHPFVNPARREALIRDGEMEYFRQCRVAFVRRVRSDPLSFFRLCSRRALYALTGEPLPLRRGVPPFLTGVVRDGIMIDKVALGTLTSALGIGGLVLAWWRGSKGLWLALAGFLSVTPYLVTSIADRYLLPLWAIFILFGGFLISSVGSTHQRSSGSD